MKKAKTLLPLLLAVLSLASCGKKPVTSASGVAGTSRPTVSIILDDDEEELVPCKVTFDLNYEGAAAPTKVDANVYKTVTAPADPTRAGFAFLGWTKEKNSQKIYDFNDELLGDTTLYAVWGAEGSKKINVFTAQAEFCPAITAGLGMQGSTYSGGTRGKGLIQNDTIDRKYKNLTNGYFVHFLYQTNNTLTFNLVSSEEVTDAVIYMNLSAEYKQDFTISPNGATEGTEEVPDAKYTIKINDQVVNYNPIHFTDVPLQGGGTKDFAEYLLASGVTLHAGNNKIEMITDNTVKMYGTALSTAPMIDCLKIYSTSKITWPEANAKNIEPEAGEE